ncbi:MAG: transcriptional regulator, Crp/Fnr family [Firmicutes bacterium]|nr:transcriptional regulator, Crp/Fnr family [Bacillota bacterium]
MKDLEASRLCSPWIGPMNVAWEKVLHLGQKICYPKGSLVTGNGETIDRLLYLYEGKIKLTNIGPNGDEKTVWHFDKGNIIGEVPFIDRRPCWNMFLVIEDCIVYSFSRQCIYEEILPKNPELVMNLVESLAHKLRVVVMHSSDLDCLQSRVCKMLVYLSEREGKNVKGSVKVACQKGICQQELASLLGIHRVTLNTVIAQLKKDGVLETISKKSLVINDYPALLELARKSE